MNLTEQFNLHKSYYQAQPYPSIATRRKSLIMLKMLLKNEAESIITAINKDFSWRAREETLFLEIFPTLKSIDYCLKNLKHWAKPRKRQVAWYLKPSQAYVIAQPLGVVGIIVPWNYPLYLSIGPLVYAIAAGNQVMIKFSEQSLHLGQLINAWFKEFFSECVGGVVSADIKVAREFSSLPFNHLLFTGSIAVGKQVMKAASENLTPVTLELGGKSPVIISSTADSRHFDRLFMGKLYNAGQTCIAPDYLLVAKNVESLIETKFSEFMHTRYPDITQNKDYTHLINAQRKLTLELLLNDAKEKGARIVSFGKPTSDNKLTPSLLFNVDFTMKIMQEEIFGPLLPVLSYDTFQQAIELINNHSNPLALYYFGNSKDEINQLTYGTLSGALTINDTLVHIANDDLPFGGVGQSGFGQYHGEEGFLNFSKLKPILKQGNFSPTKWFYPPYGRLLDYFLRHFAGIKTRSNNE